MERAAFFFNFNLFIDMVWIDKTYVNLAELKEAVDWSNKVGVVTLENGYKLKPINWIRGYNDIDETDFWNRE